MISLRINKKRLFNLHFLTLNKNLQSLFCFEVDFSLKACENYNKEIPKISTKKIDYLFVLLHRTKGYLFCLIKSL